MPNSEREQLRPFPMYWMILTGEYPPQPGGVSDYTRLVARALAAAGDQVHVWVPSAPGGDRMEEGVAVHSLPDHFGRASRAALDSAFRRLPPDARVLVQYVPHAFGPKGMNVPFCWWLWSRRRVREISVMFHEVATSWSGTGSLRRRCLLAALAAVTRLMALLIGRSARRIFISIPSWEKTLRPLVGRRPMAWLPIPSTVPLRTNEQNVAACRRALLGSGRFLIGHFGTYGTLTAPALRHVVTQLLAAHPEAVILCMGRGSEEFVAGFPPAASSGDARLVATGPLRADAVAEHLSACDLLIQPYPDGVSTRRTSTMAGLALGVPILTTTGQLTEPLWAEHGAVRLAYSYRDMAVQADALLADPAERARLGAAGAALYREMFDLSRTIGQLRSTLVAANAGSPV